jgi:hypothetical protein
LTRKANGKTISVSFTSAAELRKAQREVETFHRFGQLSQELLEVNEEICRARPVQQPLTPEKKTAEAIQNEIAREVGATPKIAQVENPHQNFGTLLLQGGEGIGQGRLQSERIDAFGVYRQRKQPHGLPYMSRTPI